MSVASTAMSCCPALQQGGEAGRYAWVERPLGVRALSKAPAEPSPTMLGLPQPGWGGASSLFPLAMPVCCSSPLAPGTLAALGLGLDTALAAPGALGSREARRAWSGPLP